MSDERKLIWSLYILIWVYFIFFDNSYRQGDHIFYYLLVGWVPFLTLHFVWKPKQKTTSQNQKMEKYRLLFKFVDKNEVKKMASLWTDIEAALRQTEEDLKEFYSKTGHDEEFFESNESLEIETDLLEEFYRLEGQYKNLRIANLRMENYFSALEKIQAELEEGLGIEKAKKKLEKLKNKNAEAEAEVEVKMEISKAIGEEILALKKKHGKSWKDAMVKMDDVVERVYKKHPEWRKAKSKGKRK